MPPNRNHLVTKLFLSLFMLHLSPCASAQWTEQSPILQGPDEANNAYFGDSVAMDGNVAVVGAWLHPSGGSRRGQVYIYRYNGASWVEEQILQASDEVDDANFGMSVAVNGNVVVVGAWLHPSGGSYRGQAYVYRYNGTTWTEEQILQASDEATNANFGVSVSVTGNVAVVGAFFHPSGGMHRGQAYVYRYNGSTWPEEQILQASDEVDDAYFGNAVAASGNVAVIGAYAHPSGGMRRGQAYVFRYNGATWSQEQVLEASDEVNAAYFGNAIAVGGNVVMVGAYQHSSGGTMRGQAYIYRYNGATWPEEQILEASDEVNTAYFGNSLAFNRSVALVGAALHSSGGTTRGQAYVYRYNGATWLEEQILQASDEADKAQFGFSIAVNSRVCLVGANNHHSGGNARGQAYLFTFGSLATPTPQASPSPWQTSTPTPTSSRMPGPSPTASSVQPTFSPTGTTTHSASPAPNSVNDWVAYE